MIDPTAKQIAAFRRKIWRFYAAHGRKLPFRETDDPYKITVSEFMLQQTQVSRVLPKYETWIKRWPTWKSLARADIRALLQAWSGLGYNRRAIYLGRLANVVMGRFAGYLPDSPEVLKTLPGIGPYTANAILIFAFNRPLVAIDTNIRRVLIFEFGLSSDASRADLERMARHFLPRGRARDWHYALMDYGRLGLPANALDIPPTTKQPSFRGSRRQLRGEIIRRLTTAQRVSIDRIAKETGRSAADVRNAAHSLEREDLVHVGTRFITLRRLKTRGH
jgi:A/G-specific adenine glycosylase